ncbi:MAG TPA: RDD family protein [Candidatus Bathyarchaeia archaeon]|nr:RDD family protein [Candidatus Bathyarchaeia archaeon]
MPVNEENVSRILVVLSHPLRRKILSDLYEKGECSFTDLMNALSVDTGKLSFHIRNLEGFLEQTPTGKYKLTKTGENAIRLLGDLEAWAVEVDYEKTGSSLPLAAVRKRVYAFLIDLAIAVAVFAVYLALPYAFSLVIRGPTSILDPSVILFSLVLFWIYFTLLEGFAGQSLGKRIIGLMVVRIDGKKLFYDTAAVRNFGKVFLLPIDLIVGYSLKDVRFIRYFDKFAGTTVKDLRP